MENTPYEIIDNQTRRSGLWVKLGSSLIFVLRPVLYYLYTKKHYDIQKTEKATLDQKWTGIGQHLAFYIHMNADIILLTLFAGMKWVAVYSVYSMVIANIRALTESFTGSMEASFGELIAKKKPELLLSTYRKYSGLITAVTVVLFSCTGILILDFVRIYTKGVTDADYWQPAFAMIMVAAEALNCLAIPPASLPIASNQLRQTRWGAYGEALINITVSLALIRWNPLVGVAAGTLAATAFRSVYYSIYASTEVLKISAGIQVIKLFSYIGVILLLSIGVLKLLNTVRITGFIGWCIYAVIIFAALAVPALLVLKSYLRKING